MHGVMKNIAHLCSLKKNSVWGPDGWKKVVVCIVADGRKVVNKRVLNVLASMGIYQAGIAKNIVDNKPVKAHIYEVSLQKKKIAFIYLKFTFFLIYVVHNTNIHRFRHEHQGLR